MGKLGNWAEKKKGLKRAGRGNILKACGRMGGGGGLNIYGKYERNSHGK
jgi:hypothetical protein